MSAALQLAVVRNMAAVGVTFCVNVRTIWGGRDVILTPEQALRFAEQPVAVSAELLGVSESEYREWLLAGGRVQCEASTASGKQCGNFESGPGIDDPKDWVRHRRLSPRCVVHGGEGSEGNR